MAVGGGVCVCVCGQTPLTHTNIQREIDLHHHTLFNLGSPSDPPTGMTVVFGVSHLMVAALANCSYLLFHPAQ